MQSPANIAGTPTNNLIVRAMTDLSVANAGVADGAAVDLKATLINKSTNAPLVDQTVEFKIDGKMAAIIKTDATGLAWVKGHKAPSDLAAGPHTLEANFAGNASLAPAKSTANFALFAAKTSIKSGSYQYFPQGNEWEVNAQLMRETDNTPMADIKNAHVLVDGVEVATSKQEYSSHTMYMRFKLPAGKQGDVTTKIVFDGTEKLLSSGATAVIKAPLAPTVPTAVTMTVDPMPAVPGRLFSCNENITLMASVKNTITHAAMKDVKVKFGLTGGVYHSPSNPGSGLGGTFNGEAITNANGIATLNTQLPAWACPGSDGQTAYNRTYAATAWVEAGIAGPGGSTIMGGAVGSAIGTTKFVVQR
jgi:hypothetical protein